MTQFEQEFRWVKKVCNVKEISCSCDKCVEMCERAPCLGTPTDIINLIKAGHLKKILDTTWVVGVEHGIKPISMYQIDHRKGCPFFNKDRKCDLHDTGLKPTEGKLANCNVEGIKYIPAYAVAFTWKMKENAKIIDEIETYYFKKRKNGKK